MLRFLLSCLVLLSPIAVRAEISVIPRPLVVEEHAGTFTLTAGAKVRIEGNFPGSELILPRLCAAAGIPLEAANDGEPATVVFKRAKQPGWKTDEDYQLNISKDGIVVIGAASNGLSFLNDAGLLYGAESLAQLLESAEKTDAGIELTQVTIEDSPRFAYRGFMLDEARHFSGEAAVKRLLDGMARYKLNRLHWHLTDSPGWRIEIKRYPKLTEIGGRMNETQPTPDGPPQFYTQEQIRDIVAYAKARGIVIIPEIDMPGHADAAVLAYPEHDGGGFLQKGSTVKWPRFTYNPGKKETLEFLDNILKEVAALFPDAGMIHYGGDEVHFGWQKWPKLPEVQELMKRENLRDSTEVESWFNRRMADTINKLGFKTAGWDEITARDLPKDKTVVYWWRHDKPQVLQQALDAGYPVVLCPRRPCYFDFLQDKSHKTGRTWGGICPLTEVYNFPAGLTLNADQQKQVLGIQACLWTEAMLTQARRDFMTWPRLVALAEAGWTSEQRKDFASFEDRLKPQIPWLINHGIHTWDPFTKPAEISDKGAQPDYLDNPE